MKYCKAVLFSLFVFISSVSNAAFITTQEAALDLVFSQASFGNRPIDIRFGAATEVVAPDLLNITTNAEVNALFNMHVGPADVVNFFFIDSMSACGFTVNAGIVGCAETPGNDLVGRVEFRCWQFWC